MKQALFILLTLFSTVVQKVIASAPDSVLTIEIGGIKQVIEIKTADDTKPILLFLAGGPGGSIMNSGDKFTDQLKDKFTIVQWDQRGAGKTLALNPTVGQPTVAQMDNDTYEVIQFLLKKLNKKKVYLAGFSWGNVLGFDIGQKHPELLHAYLAINPVVNQLESEKELLSKLIALYTDKNNAAALKELASVKIPFEAEEDLFYLRKWLFVMDGQANATGGDFKKFFLNWAKTWFPAWQEVMRINLSQSLPEIKCPIYFFVGGKDIQTSTSLTTAYFNSIKAPKKDLYMFEEAKHSVQSTDPKKFQKIILQNILIKDY